MLSSDSELHIGKSTSAYIGGKHCTINMHLYLIMTAFLIMVQFFGVLVLEWFNGILGSY